MTTLIIWGAGGHARVVIDAIRSGPDADTPIVVVDDNLALHGERLLGCSVAGGRAWLQRQDRKQFLVMPAIGNNKHRNATMTWANAEGFDLTTVRHPSAIVGIDADIGRGCFLAPGAIVNTAARLGAGVIVNTAASVDHDCVVGRASHIGPGARLCGDVTLGTSVLVGVGASIAPGVSVGDDAIVGAGAAVVRDVAGAAIVGGAPARVIGRM